jgi:hypothetical protein
VGLIASIIEKTGIPTVCLSLLREASQKVKPPRTLLVPYGFGYPLGAPGDQALQSRIVREGLGLLVAADFLPILQDFSPGI